MAKNEQGGSTLGEMEAGSRSMYSFMKHPFSGMKNAITGAISNSALSGIAEYTESEVADFKKFIEDGHWSWQVLGCIGGILMTAVGLYNCLFDVLNVAPLNAVTDAYIAGFGALSVCLEYKEGMLPESWRKLLQKEFLFVYKPYGRAFLYTLFGLLMFSEPKITYMIVGPYVTGVGLLISYVSSQANAEFARMRETQRLDQTHLRSLFNKADKGGWFNRDGVLDSKEFAGLYRDLMHLPGPPDLNELEMALLEIDTEHNGKIEFSELETWYNKKMDGTL
jgi:hypothetical protein